MSDLRDAIEEVYEDEPEVATEELADIVEAVESPEPADEEAKPEPVAEESVPEPEGESEPVQAGSKAPVDWSPELRETWGDLPAPVRDKVLAREKHMEEAMRGTANARQAFGELQQLQTQYGSILAAEGTNNPIQAVQGLLQTTAELRMGTPSQKAERMAQLITHFGVDIGMLDNAIVGEAPASQEVSQMEQLLDQRMAPVNQMMSQLAGMQQNSQQQASNSIQQEMEAFQGKAEFLQDVRGDMADLLDLATKRGEEMTLQTAYDRACAFHPEISSVLAKRQSQQSMVSKKNAASSIRGSGQGNSGTKAPESLSGQLNAIWDDLAG